VLLSSFAYVALRLVLANERRLLSVENELAVAREIQASILPAGFPELEHARVAAAYCPMTDVAGDFYEFLPVDRGRAGFLVADVCGHGVPAALIASMLKVAVETVAACAGDPGQLLRGLNRVLTRQLRGKLVSAAYLWLAPGQRPALAAAAGHPPLLRWRGGRLERLESNGLLFGVLPDCHYPVLELPLEPGDRLLLCTDGIVEPENAAGEAFGDRELERVLAGSEACSPAELSDRLLAAIRRWQAAPSQQDDMTLLVIDVA
jgi:phosphoserine phosphatase RsbU/P